MNLHLFKLGAESLRFGKELRTPQVSGPQRKDPELATAGPSFVLECAIDNIRIQSPSMLRVPSRPPC